LGDRISYLNQAIQHIETDIASIQKASSVYETQSWGKTDSPDYLNQVVLLQSNLSSQIILEKVLAIEITMGRIREEKWGSRIIDIDILFYDSDIINAPGLHVPHPELHNRRFTLEPLVEISPLFVHPVLKKTVTQLKNELNDSLVVKKLYF